MTQNKIAAALTAIVGLATFGLCLAMMAYAFTRGLGAADESLAVYLLVHPLTAMPFMDHFIWGPLFAALHLDLSGIRWATLLLILMANSALCISGIAALRNTRRTGEQEFSQTLPWVLTLLGTLLYYCNSWPTLNHGTTAIIAGNLFAAAMFSFGHANRRARISLDAAMGLAAALAFAARPPLVIFLLFFRVLHALLLERPIKRTALLHSVIRICTVMVAALLCAIALGYNISNQILLIGVLTKTSHSLYDLLHVDFIYGVYIVLAACIGTVVYVLTERALNKGQGYAFGSIFLTAVSAAVAAAIAQMFSDGYFTAALPSVNMFGNPAPKSWGPAIHAGTLCLFFVRTSPLFSSYVPMLKNLFASAYDRETDLIIRFAFLLYLLTLLSQFGTNTGLWHRSILNMGPLFLAIAMILTAAGRQKQFSAWHAPILTLLIAIPIILEMHTNLLLRPPNLNGSIYDQTVVLVQPRALKGLRVTSQQAATQREFDQILSRNNFDRKNDVIVPPIGKTVLANLLDVRGLGGGWFFSGYNGASHWNCQIIKIGIRKLTGRVFVIEPDTIPQSMKNCFTTYGLQLTTREQNVEIFRRKPDFQ